MAYPKRINATSQTRRHLWFDAEDINLLAKRLSNRFYHTFTRGFPLRFSYGGDHLAFSPTRFVTPDAARRHLRGLGVAPRLIDMAVNAIKGYVKEGFPKPDHVRFDLWFRSLSQKFFPGDKIKEAIAKDAANLRKWEIRLGTCGRAWNNVSLSDGAVIRVTRILFKVMLKQEVTEDALKKQLRRWKKGEWVVSHHGQGGHMASPDYDIPPQSLIDL